MILPPQKKIVVIGDIHGDLTACLIVLKKANLISVKKGSNGIDIDWVAPSGTIVVQIGDQIDRAVRLMDSQDIPDEDNDLMILQLFDKLDNLAQKKGSRVISLLGNHELMNVYGDMTYVSPAGIIGMGGYDARVEKFKPGGEICMNHLIHRPVVLKIGDWVFCHAGVRPYLANKYSIQLINGVMRIFLSGNLKPSDVNMHIFNELFISENSILWNRKYGKPSLRTNDKDIQTSLKRLKAKYMVIGHTPYREKGIHRVGNIFRVDCALSQSFGRHQSTKELQLLEILDNGNTIKIIS